jgi:hypothetical protein
VLINHIPQGEFAVSQTREKWASVAEIHMKSELKRAKVTYAELARRMTQMGLVETEGTITGKLNRGTYSGWFYVAAMDAIGRPVAVASESAETLNG